MHTVNMAKVVLKLASDQVDEQDAKLGGDAFISELLQSIINGQNAQINLMYNYLHSVQVLLNLFLCFEIYLGAYILSL